jgi:hypothetical protein
MPARSTSKTGAARVVQASFAPGKAPRVPPKPAPTEPDGKAPATKATRSPGAQAGRPPHPATLAQRKVRPSPKERPPHPASVVAQRRETPAKKERPPHPASVAQRSRKAVQGADGNAFEAPAKLLRRAPWENGQPLPEAIQRQMAERFGGADFSAVRVHEGPQAESIGALAFTTGDDVYFAQGQYRPETKRGQELLGKQLAYVVQQREGRVKNPFGSGVAVVQDPALEAEAAVMAGARR